MSDTPPPSAGAVTRSLERERNARKEAETLLEKKSRELYDIMVDLRHLNNTLEESEERYRTLVELMPDAIWIHHEGRVIFTNPAALRLFGADSAESMLGRDASTLVPAAYRAQVAQVTFADIQAAQHQPRIAMQVERLDGALVDVEFFGCAIRFDHLDAVMNVAHDITERMQHEKAIEHQATHDQLTGLPNRALFLDRLTHSIRRAERLKGRLAVMFVDLDKFKAVNDTLGHAAGDELLCHVAGHLVDCVRSSDTVARMGGDEFVLLLDNPLGETTPGMIAERVSARLGLPVTLGGKEHVITGSIGISVFPEDGGKAEVLLRQADIAMYRAKESGRNSYQFFTSDMQSRLDARVALEQGLHKALLREEFILHYQPQVDVKTGRIVGMEALLRWQSPDLGLVPPLHFIPVAEESNLIMAIGAWVLGKVCATLRAWEIAGVPIVPCAVNVAASQFSQQDLDRIVRDTLDKHGLNPKYLELELTESLSMDDPEATISMMHRLRMTGVGMSIDDFGTGYSNLTYLKRFPVDKLKVDQSFTRGLTSNAEDRSIVTAVIRLAHSLGLRAIAEGVETEGQLRLLAEQGCDEIQGYFFSRPLTEAAMLALLRKPSNALELLPIEPGAGASTVLLVNDEPYLQASLRAILDRHSLQLLVAKSVDDAFEMLAAREVAVVVCDAYQVSTQAADFFPRVQRLYPRTVRLLLESDRVNGLEDEGIFGRIAHPWNDDDVGNVVNGAVQHFRRWALQ